MTSAEMSKEKNQGSTGYCDKERLLTSNRLLRVTTSSRFFFSYPVMINFDLPRESVQTADGAQRHFEKIFRRNLISFYRVNYSHTRALHNCSFFLFSLQSSLNKHLCLQACVTDVCAHISNILA